MFTRAPKSSIGYCQGIDENVKRAAVWTATCVSFVGIRRPPPPQIQPPFPPVSIDRFARAASAVFS